MSEGNELIKFLGDLVPKLPKGLSEFIGKVVGPAGEETGLWLQDKVRVRRFENTMRMFKRANELMSDAELKPTEVQLNILFPLLEGASLEEDDSLVEKWAALMANAASAEGKKIHPSFAHILGQLTPTDVRLLDWLFDQTFGGENPGIFVRESTLAIEELKLDVLDFEISAGSIVRSGLCETVSVLKTAQPIGMTPKPSGLTLTTLGANFVAACKNVNYKPIRFDKPPSHDIHQMPSLDTDQEAMLKLIYKIQQQNSAIKLIINREDASVRVDNNDKELTLVANLAEELWGSSTSARGQVIERRIDSLPTVYLERLPESRWGNPFVVRVTEAGKRYLQSDF